MDWRTRLLTLLASVMVAAGLASPGAAEAATPGCPDPAVGCSGQVTPINDGTEVDLRGQDSSHRPPSSNGGDKVYASSSHTLTAAEAQALLDAACYGAGTCSNRGNNDLNVLFLPADDDPADGDDTPARTVTISDVARFLPAVAGLHAEPDGWAVVDLPANFWVDVEPITVDGELLGGPAQVRFTPRLYQWDYGDGSTRTTTDPGAAWAALGQEELTETPTSHSYAARGTVQPRVTVVYSAEYRVDGGDWLPVAGAVTGTTPPLRTLVVRERTALTAG